MAYSPPLSYSVSESGGRRHRLPSLVQEFPSPRMEEAPLARSRHPRHVDSYGRTVQFPDAQSLAPSPRFGGRPSMSPSAQSPFFPLEIGNALDAESGVQMQLPFRAVPPMHTGSPYSAHPGRPSPPSTSTNSYRTSSRRPSHNEYGPRSEVQPATAFTNRRSTSSSSSPDLCDRRASVASGSTAPTSTRGLSGLQTPDLPDPLRPSLPDTVNLPSVFGHSPGNQTPYAQSRPPPRVIRRMPTETYDQTKPDVDERVPQNAHLDENQDANSYRSRHSRPRNSPSEDCERKDSAARPSARQVRSLRNTTRSMNFENISTSAGDSRMRRRRGNLPKPITDLLKGWFQDHLAHPYPSEEEKHELLDLTGLNMGQLSNWFINCRRRCLPKMHRGAEAEEALKKRFFNAQSESKQSSRRSSRSSSVSSRKSSRNPSAARTTPEYKRKK